MRPIACLLGRHRRVRLITGVEHRGGGRFEVTESRYRCARLRCKAWL